MSSLTTLPDDIVATIATLSITNIENLLRVNKSINSIIRERVPRAKILFQRCLRQLPHTKYIILLSGTFKLIEGAHLRFVNMYHSYIVRGQQLLYGGSDWFESYEFYQDHVIERNAAVKYNDARKTYARDTITYDPPNTGTPETKYKEWLRNWLDGCDVKKVTCAPKM